MISSNGKPVAVRENRNPLDHASFVQPAIADLMAETGVTKNQIVAVAVANGPGSYTGLRVGLASAKGLCYAWVKPLITISSLRLMALAIRPSGDDLLLSNCEKILLAPMIDARRMEVFFALFNNCNHLQVVCEPSAAIIDNSFLSNLPDFEHIYFTGDGSEKWKAVCNLKNASFIQLPIIDNSFALDAFREFTKGNFADIAYAEPFYTKEFYSPLIKHL
jgi:tRNA threonylcarbamoyladenosine biosynthesis protein TsaB